MAKLRCNVLKAHCADTPHAFFVSVSAKHPGDDRFRQYVLFNSAKIARVGFCLQKKVLLNLFWTGYQP